MKKAIDLSKEKINYVAIGDSVTEGYSEYLQFGDAGKLEKNHLKGTSWPSFFVHFLNNIKPGLVASYHNFALSSSRPEDWNYFLGSDLKDKYNKLNSQQKIKIIKSMHGKKHHLHTERLKKYFNNFKYDNYDFLLEKIKAANLITFNIGANFLLPKISYEEFLKLFFVKSEQNVDIFKINLQKLISSVSKDLTVMINRLKKLNKKAHIICVGYVLPYNEVFKLVNHLFKNFKDITNEDVVTFVVNSLNQELDRICEKTKITFIDTFNEEFWSKNYQILSPIFYDIHPVAKGYKKIAQDVLLKLSLSNQFKLKYTKESIANLIPTFNLNYLNKDFDNWNNCLDFQSLAIDDQTIINSIYGKKNQLLEEDLKQEVIAQKKYQPFDIEKIIDLNSQSGIVFRVKEAIYKFLTLLNLNNDEINNTDYLEKIFELKKINHFLLEKKFISKFFWNIQEELNKLYQTKKIITHRDFINILILEIFSIKNFPIYMQIFVIYLESSEKISKEFFNFLNKVVSKILEKKEIQKLISTSILRIINVLMKKINLIILERNWTEFIFKLDLKDKITNLIKEIYIYSKLHLEKIKKITKPERLFKFYFLHEFKSIDVYQIIQKIFNDSELNKIFCNFISRNLKLMQLNESENQLIGNFIFILLRLLNNNGLIKEILIEIIILIFFNPSKKSEKLLQESIDFLLGANKKTFNKYFNFFKSIQINENNKDNWEIGIDSINLIFQKTKSDGFIFDQIQQISKSTLIFYHDNDKPNILKMLSILDKITSLIKPLQSIFDQLYQKYLETKNPNKVIDYDNRYYQFIFRIILSFLLINYNLFQKKLNKNIFWLNWLGNKISPSIVNILFRFLVPKNEPDKSKINFFLTLLGEEDNPNLNNSFTESTYKSKQLLWYVFSYYKHEWDRHSGKKKIDIILESLQKGYWILKEDD